MNCQITSSAKETPTADFKSSSPLRGFYQEWQELASQPVDTTDETFLSIKSLASLSRTKYISSPVAFPDNLRAALLRVMTSAANTSMSNEIELRRRILRQLKYHLTNQAKRASTINQLSGGKWISALTALKSGVARHGTGKMFLTVYRLEEAESVLKIADEAACLLWEEQQLRVLNNPSYDADRSADSISAQIDKHPEWSDDHRTAFIASRHLEPITISAHAKHLGIIFCDQSKGIIKVKGGKSYNIPKTSYLPWTAIRLLVTSSTGESVLWPKWDTSWGRNALKICFKKEWIKPLSTSKRFNGLKFRLKKPEINPT